MLELKDLSVGYGDRIIAGNINMTFPNGAVSVILGPNGSGKSTLMKTAAGLLAPRAGTILLEGVPTAAMSSRERARRVAYLPQSRPVPSITARHLVLHGRFPHLGYPRHYTDRDRQIVAQSLKAVGAEAFADMPMTALSGGQCQRIYIAMALTQDTPTVILDEPTNFLDVGCQLELMQLARTLADSGKAVILILHDICLALRYADRAAILSEGTLAAAGSPEEIFRDGVLDRVFGVPVRRLETPDGWRYYYG